MPPHHGLQVLLSSAPCTANIHVREAGDIPVQKVSQLCAATDLDSHWDVGINTLPDSQRPVFKQLQQLFAAEQYDAALELYLQVGMHLE